MKLLSRIIYFWSVKTFLSSVARSANNFFIGYLWIHSSFEVESFVMIYFSRDLFMNIDVLLITGSLSR